MSKKGWAFLEFVVTNSNFQLHTTCLLLPWQQNENSEHIHACPIKDTNLPIFIFLNKPLQLHYVARSLQKCPNIFLVRRTSELPDLRKGYLCTHPSSEQIYHDVFCTHMSECLRKLAQAVKQPCMYLIFSYSAQSKGMNCLV